MSYYDTDLSHSLVSVWIVLNDPKIAPLAETAAAAQEKNEKKGLTSPIQYVIICTKYGATFYMRPRKEDTDDVAETIVVNRQYV